MMPNNDIFLFMDTKITFIIPSIGRPTLNKTIDSLLAQNKSNWKAIIVFDGVDPINVNDPRIQCYQISKTGIANHAGRVRNFAIDKVDTEWMAFVDDDDTLSANYLNYFEEEISSDKDADCVIFRMLDKGFVFPEDKTKKFVINHVGISFAVRKNLNIKFEPSCTEDFYYLNTIREMKKKIILSSHLTYFVRTDPKREFDYIKFNREIF